MRDCIRKYTSGAPEGNGRWPDVVHKGNMLHVFGKREHDGEVAGTSRKTQEAAKKWWREEIRNMEWLLGVWCWLKLGTVVDEDSIEAVAFMNERPTLREAGEVLDAITGEPQGNVRMKSELIFVGVNPLEVDVPVAEVVFVLVEGSLLTSTYISPVVSELTNNRFLESNANPTGRKHPSGHLELSALEKMSIAAVRLFDPATGEPDEKATPETL
ncbi:hypothetical protein B7494_g8398 [Chlorociboria aeruginascens]|nr:hypothetical protein B7494_g8398 [Chlorociboria aeruginascens]